jgi:phosphoglycolate phosphatase-like HAD superfamily hydrolase
MSSTTTQDSTQTSTTRPPKKRRGSGQRLRQKKTQLPSKPSIEQHAAEANRVTAVARHVKHREKKAITRGPHDIGQVKTWAKKAAKNRKQAQQLFEELKAYYAKLGALPESALNHIKVLEEKIKERRASAAIFSRKAQTGTEELSEAELAAIYISIKPFNIFTYLPIKKL